LLRARPPPLGLKFETEYKPKLGDYKMSIELKIKSKHLAEEAKIIRHEERKLRYQGWWLSTHEQDATEVQNTRMSLNHHRRWDVRNENRATFLARAYLKQVPYNTVEIVRKPENEHTFKAYVVPKVLTMVNKYGKMNNTTVPAIIDDIRKWSGIE
jgi:hypothetical protein